MILKKILQNAVLCAAILTLNACSIQEPDFDNLDSHQSNTQDIPKSIASSTVQAWYDNANYRINKQNRIGVNWQDAKSINVDNKQLMLVPIEEEHDYFKSSEYKGFRYLVVEQKKNQKLSGVIIEILANSKNYVRRELLCEKAYASLFKGKKIFPNDFTGLVLFYTPTYEYLTGFTIRNGTADSKSARLKLVTRPGASSQSLTKSSSAAPLSSLTVYQTCTDWYNANTGEPWGSTCTYETVPDPDLPGPPPTGNTGGSGGGSWGGPNPTAPLNPLIVKLQTNSMALFGPCPGLNNDWLPVLQYQAPYPVISRLNALSAAEQEIIIQKDWTTQVLSTAGGVAVNLDYFSVTIEKANMPFVNGASGPRFTPDQFLQHIRLNLSSLIDPNASSPMFAPHPELIREGERWANNPLGSILAIKIPFNNGSVIVSDYALDHWTFSTIHDPYLGDHPVSGNRMFGYRDTPKGWEFYTRGADRIYSRPEELTGYLLAGEQTALQFIKGDQVWRNLQLGIARFCLQHHGYFTINDPVVNRPNWESVLGVLQQTDTNLQEVTCP